MASAWIAKMRARAKEGPDPSEPGTPRENAAPATIEPVSPKASVKNSPRPARPQLSRTTRAVDPWDDDAPAARNTRATRAARAAPVAPVVELTPAQKAAQKHERRAAVNAAHEIRIIGGQWRRRMLPVPDLPGLRPTPDRVRETLFNWLGQDLTGWKVLDAFAGTGVLGFEAASRGAESVQMLERETRLVAGLGASKTKLGASAVTITQADAMAWMKRASAQFDLVFLDPPFDANLFESALAASLHCVVPQGWIYLEASAPFDAASLAERGLELYRHSRAGAVHAHLIRKN
jgi:16S rRNA (guanine(966)-N(2))-methyltransferase RsmD